METPPFEASVARVEGKDKEGGVKKGNAALRGMIYGRCGSIAECARRMGWTRNRLDVLVLGKREPNIGELAPLAAALGCSVAEVAAAFLKEKGR